MKSLTLSALILALCAAWAWWWPVGLVILFGSMAFILLALSGLVALDEALGLGKE